MQYYKLTKDAVTWDCFNHPDDVAKYVGKILREEPTASLRVIPITHKQFRNWKES